MNSYDRLRDLTQDQRAVDVVSGAFHAITAAGVHPQHALTHMADRLCSMYGLSAEVHHNAVMFYHAASRAKQPACLVVSRNAGQAASPSCMAYRRTPHALIQAFEGDADDTEVAGHSPQPTHWLQTQGRVLWH